MATRHLYLVRHGQQESPDTARGKGNGLSAVGKQQAQRTAEYLQQYPITAIYHSTMLRAVETARAIATRLPEAHVRGMRQLWECVPFIPPALAQYLTETPEEAAAARAQLDRAFARLFKPARRQTHESIVCHGNVIRYLVCRVLDAPPAAWVRMDIYNGGISQIIVDPQVVREREMVVLTFNEIAHIPPELRTFQ